MSVQVVSFHCVLKNSFGHVLGSTFNQEILVAHQPADTQLRGLVEALRNLKSGEKRKVYLKADQAYGFYDPKLIIKRSLQNLETDQPLKLGETIVYKTTKGSRIYKVIEITKESVTLDGNHPLAGQDLTFEIEATEARDATPADMGLDPVLTPGSVLN
jgi:FKBP-type peptidyl-prolyl cis-trans isomerase SlyD